MNIYICITIYLCVCELLPFSSINVRTYYCLKMNASGGNFGLKNLDSCMVRLISNAYEWIDDQKLNEQSFINLPGVHLCGFSG